MKSKHQHFLKLREEYPVFHYDTFDYQFDNQNIKMQFKFRVEELTFQPEVCLQLGNHALFNGKKEEIEGLVFHIGLIELISYWKCVCSPTICIHPYLLENGQQDWWRKLYWHGLGEFFYINQITTQRQEFFNFTFAPEAKTLPQENYKNIAASQKIIVPIGGGKDSVVTLEHYKEKREIIPFIINPRGATLSCAKVAGFHNKEDIVILKRSIDPLLLTCNSNGYLNGHTPFSAMLAFYTLLVSYGTQCRDIALSNEASANEATVLNSDVNHQYSKSLEFEEDFREYVEKYMNNCAHYYSYLRPFTELEIAQQFAKYKPYHLVFRSCNAGSKEDKWCCECPKCLFAYIILAPYLTENEMIEIFGENLIKKPSLQHFLLQLTGKEETKPFECVGTVEEVNEALKMIGI